MNILYVRSGFVGCALRIWLYEEILRVYKNNKANDLVIHRKKGKRERWSNETYTNEWTASIKFVCVWLWKERKTIWMKGERFIYCEELCTRQSTTNVNKNSFFPPIYAFFLLKCCWWRRGWRISYKSIYILLLLLPPLIIVIERIRYKLVLLLF